MGRIISRHLRSTSLLELLIAIILVSLVAVGFTSIDLFSRHHVLSSDRLAKLQNELSYILEHMNKEISGAIGDTEHASVTIEDSKMRIRFYSDINQDGKISEGDYEKAYQFLPLSHEVNYYSSYPDSSETLSKKISSCSFQHTWTVAQKDNYVTVNISACWDPDGDHNSCGSSENPGVAMHSRIRMPSVSTN